MPTKLPPARKTPHAVAVEYALGLLDARDLPWYAADWLADGYHGPNLIRLACLDDSDPQANADLLAAVLGEVDEPVPAIAVAADEWLDGVARRLDNGEIDERTVCRLVDAFLSDYIDEPDVWHSPFVDLGGMADYAYDAMLVEVRVLCGAHLNRCKGT